MRILCKTAILLFAALTGCEGEKGDHKAVEKPVRMIDVCDVALAVDANNPPRLPHRGGVENPKIIVSAVEMSDVFENQKLVDRLLARVDFTKEKALYFGWGGSGGDSLDWTTIRSEKGLEVRFTYSKGYTHDRREFRQLWVIPKIAAWTFRRNS